LFVWQLVGKLL